MLCPVIKVLVTRAANEQIPTQCYAHQLALLAEIHGSENLHVMSGDKPLCSRPLRYQEEYSRLSNLYGQVPEEKYTYVEHIFGPMTSGRLRDEMMLGMGCVDRMTGDMEDIVDLDEEEEEAPAPEGPEQGSYPWMKQQLNLYGVDFVHHAKKVDLDQLLRAEYCERLSLEWPDVAKTPLGQLADQLVAASPAE